MGLEFVRALDYIDSAVIGEGDDGLPALLDALAGGADLSRRDDTEVLSR